MTKENLIPQTATVHKILTFEEFMQSYKKDEKLENYYKEEWEAEVLNGPQYGPGKKGKNKNIKTNKRTEAVECEGQHLINTLNDWADKGDKPTTLRAELWNGEEAISYNDKFNFGIGSAASSAGISAGVGGAIASGDADFSLIRIKDCGGEAKFLSASVGGEAGIGLLGSATLGCSINLDLIDVKSEGIHVKVGVDLGSGVAAGLGGVEVKAAGFGVSVGKKMGVSTPVGGVSVDLEEACVIQ